MGLFALVTKKNVHMLVTVFACEVFLFIIVSYQDLHHLLLALASIRTRSTSTCVDNVLQLPFNRTCNCTDLVYMCDAAVMSWRSAKQICFLMHYK